MILALVGLMLVGCSGVILSPTYSRLLDQTADLSAQTAQRAHDGTLPAGDMRDALVYQSIVWQRFCNARDGIHNDALAPPTTQPTLLLDLAPVPK